MSRSERAAGLIPFIIMLVLFLAAVGVWYLFYTKAEKLEGDLAAVVLEKEEQEVQKGLYSRQLRDIVDLMGFKGEGTVSETVNEGTPKKARTYSVEQIADVERARNEIKNELAKWEQGEKMDFKAWSLEFADDNIKKRPDGSFEIKYFELGDKRPENIKYAEIFPYIDAAFKRYRTTTATFKTLIEDYEDALKQAQAKEQQVNDDLTSRLNAQRTDFQQRNETLQSSISDMRDSKDRLEVKVTDLTDEKDKIQAELEEAKKQFENEKLALVQQLQRLKKQIEIDRVPTPDGQVLAASTSTGIAVINRGKRDNLKPGTVFQAYNFAKGGVKRAKGVLKVIDVFDTQAKCAILQASAGDPIVEGDLIINDLYNPDKALHFFILGKLTKYGNTEATAVLERMGNKVDGQLGVLTDYVILGQKENSNDPNLEDSEEYRKAKELGVKVITEKQLEAFTKY